VSYRSYPRSPRLVCSMTVGTRYPWARRQQSYVGLHAGSLFDSHVLVPPFALGHGCVTAVVQPLPVACVMVSGTPVHHGQRAFPSSRPTHVVEQPLECFRFSLIRAYRGEPPARVSRRLNRHPWYRPCWAISAHRGIEVRVADLHVLGVSERRKARSARTARFASAAASAGGWHGPGPRSQELLQGDMCLCSSR